MKRFFLRGRVLFAGISFVAVLVGAAVLLGPATDEADAFGPVGPPLCGPTYLWNCTGGGIPDVQFAGTKCDKFAHEQATGQTCTAG